MFSSIFTTIDGPIQCGLKVEMEIDPSCANSTLSSIEMKRQQMKKKERVAVKKEANILSPLLRREKRVETVSDGDTDDEEDVECEDELRSNTCLQAVVSSVRRMIRRKKCRVDNEDDSSVEEDARFKLRRFSERLDGVNSMLNEKISHVQRKLEALSERCNELADKMLTNDPSINKTCTNINRIDLISVMKEMDVFNRQYDFFSNIRVNLIKLRANTDVHAFSDTVKDALSLIPSNMKKIRAEKEFCLATRYSDALDDFAQRMELPLSTVELAKIDLEESYEVQIDSLLKERQNSSSPQIVSEVRDPGRQIQPTVFGSTRRVPILLN
jgi:hypothetical protein